MKIYFKNIKKNTLPLLVNTTISFEDYFNNLTTSSKRFFNLSYRLYDKIISSELNQKYPCSKKIDSNGLIRFIFNKNNPNPDFFIHFFERNELISYNGISPTKSDKTVGYCNCLENVDEKYNSMKHFNTYTWFKTIEHVIKEKKNGYY
jgi:hypothetical protein